MSYRVEITAAADFEGHPSSKGVHSSCSSKITKDGATLGEFEAESRSDWEALLAEAEFVVRGGSGEPGSESPAYETGERLSEVDENERERRIYRGRAIAMLRRYMRYSIETGRLPSILGREFFRAKVTSYTVVTVEDRVIFVHDMESCLAKLDEFSQKLIARHILQEHDRPATARLLGCNEKTVRRLTPLALDVLCEILLDVGLMEPLNSKARKTCQGGFESQNSVSSCE